MKALSSAVSITVHAAVGVAVLLGTTTTVRSNPAPTDTITYVFPPETHSNPDPGLGGPIVMDPIPVTPPSLNFSPSSVPLPTGVVSQPLFSPAFSPTARSGSSPANGWTAIPEEHAEVLSGPLPVYPDLLRQAGVQGRVLLEAVVDTTGRVLAASILVVQATNPGFVASARQALLATLFRPAMINSQLVRMRVRIPYEFAIRNGMGYPR